MSEKKPTKHIKKGRGYRITAQPIKNSDEEVVSVLEGVTDVTDRKKKEKEIQQEHGFLMQLLETSPVSITVVNQEGQITLANSLAENLLGLKRSDIYNRRYNDPAWRITDFEGNAYPDEKLPFQMVKDTESPVFGIEHAIEWPDGKRVLLSINAAPLFNNTEKFSGMVAVMEDVTSRKQLEWQLREKNQFIQTILDNLPIGLAINYFDKGTATYINKQFEKIYGWPKEELKDVQIFFQKVYPDPVYRQKIQTRVLQDIKSGDPKRMQWDDIEATAKDGSKRIISAKNIPIFDQNFMISTVQDVTERKQAQDALIESEKKYRELVESANSIILRMDSGGQILYINKFGKDFFGFSEEEIIGKNAIGTIIPVTESTGRNLKNMFSNIIRHPENYTHNENENTRKNGERVWVSWTNKTIIAENGNVPEILSIGNDITERKLLEAKLRQAQKMESIGSLAGGIAHDFNNILFPIVGMSEMLMEDLPLGSPEHESAIEIYNASIRGSDLVKQILAFSRQSEQKKIPISIQKILREVIKLSRSTIPSNITITTDIQSDCSLVLADPTQVHQIAMNLITNAYHAVEPKNGEITVRLREVEIGLEELSERELLPGRYALLSFSDTGLGIDPAIKEKIFDPYFTTKKQGKGTGLGLAVVYGIVKDHLGDIKVYSELGKGTTFNIYLPIMAQPEKSSSVEMKKVFQTGHERILFVDDEEAIAKLGKQMLERLGYKVTIRVSSLEALEVFKTKPNSFDLVISDMTMPQLTGDQLARELMAIRPDIPIIICTGFSERINQEKAASIGAKGFLMKPIVRSQLAAMVRNVLDKAK